jgi:hypothetical protein
MELFGWKIEKKEEEKETKSPFPMLDDEGSLIIEKNWVPGADHDAYAVATNFDDVVSSESELITKYREMSQLPEVDYAVDDIINELMSVEKANDIVDIDLDELEYSKGVKNKITDEFNHILTLLDFNNSAYEIARNWYVDGRLTYEIIVDEKDYVKNGIKEVRYIDPRTIRKIKEIKNSQGRANAILKQLADEYYIYSPTGFGRQSFNTGSISGTDVVKMSDDSVVHVTSGIMNHNKTMVQSHLHKAIRPLNQLRALEDASIIYRISRAPERRIFYIDVGNLPKGKAEQHLQNIAQKYKNKLVYDGKTGEIRDDRKFMTMTEDYFLPRRSDGKATEITTLPGGQNLGELEEVNYFLNKFYRSLNLPISRLESQSGFQFGRQTEISRDELKFAKFVARLRKRFAQLFIKLLRRQLVLKNIMTAEEFDSIKNNISFEFSADNLIAENKEQEVLAGRLDILNNIDTYKGVYFSKQFILRNVLRMSQEDIDEMEQQIGKEKKTNEYDEDNQLKSYNADPNAIAQMNMQQDQQDHSQEVEKDSLEHKKKIDKELLKKGLNPNQQTQSQEENE